MHMLTCVLCYARLVIMSLSAYFSRCFPSSFPVFAPCFQRVYFLSFENVCLLSFALARFLGRLVATKLIVKELVHDFRFQSVPCRLSNSILCSLLHLYTLLYHGTVCMLLLLYNTAIQWLCTRPWPNRHSLIKQAFSSHYNFEHAFRSILVKKFIRFIYIKICDVVIAASYQDS